jgi:hypothetical protein
MAKSSLLGCGFPPSFYFGGQGCKIEMIFNHRAANPCPVCVVV